MPSIGPSIFTLGVIMISVIAAQMPQDVTQPTSSSDLNHQNTGMTYTTPTRDFTSDTSSTVDHTGTDWTTKTDNDSSLSTMPSMSWTTPAPSVPSKITTSSTKKEEKTVTTVKPKPPSNSNDSIGIIVLILIILVAVGFGVTCYIAKKRGNHYSVDLTSRPDDANIPLSTVEPVEAAPQNGLQTFEPVETHEKEPSETEEKPEELEALKADDPSAESAAPAPSSDSSEDKPKKEVTEQSLPPPVEPDMEEKTDDEGVNSNKTSVESLKETNENNSNNADVNQKKDLTLANNFWEVPLDNQLEEILIN
ncbi:uncharacterized protein ACBR49_000680 [Aulostomus maculatus]